MVSFRALLIESIEPVLIKGTQAFNSYSINRKGIFGWTPLHKIYRPKPSTLGSWDYFHKNVYRRSQIKCHNKVSSKYYDVEEYTTLGNNLTLNDFGLAESDARKRDYLIKSGKGTPSAYVGGRIFHYSYRGKLK